MTKKDFIEKYPSIIAKHPSNNAKLNSKSWKTILMLEKEDRLDIFSYCDVMVKEIDIVRFSGFSSTQVNNYKSSKVKSSIFIYATMREKSVRELVSEFEAIEKASTKI